MLTKLSEIAGIGKSKEKKLADAGILCPVDLALYFPARYIDLDDTESWRNTPDGSQALVFGALAAEPKTAFVRGLRITTAKCNAGGSVISLSWFNKPYISAMLGKGGNFYFYGKLTRTKSGAKLTNPSVIKEEERSYSKIFAEYKSVGGLATNSIRAAISQILDSCEISGLLDGIAGVEPLLPAVRDMHFPLTVEAAQKAYQRIVTEQLVKLIASYRIGGGSKKIKRSAPYKHLDGGGFLARLPFTLTDGQKRAAADIVSDLSGDTLMNRIVTGDVGSGKTVVAFYALYLAAMSGYQAAMMCPTEILAAQHYKKALEIFQPLGIDVCLLTASLTRAQRSLVLFNIENGVSGIVIGTHSVLSEDVHFRALSLAVIDEQHRFGVNQRSELAKKSHSVDLLVMSATPIPRTVSLILYGELNSSDIPGKPGGGADIKTAFVPTAKLGSMYKYIEEGAAAGIQSYFVCPQIGSDDGEDADTDADADAQISAKGLFASLRGGGLKNTEIALLHGKTPAKDKERIMSDFYAGRVSVLISTTVVEVGLDNPNAKNMVIFHPERYGLSQLHQLRGRVGRDGQEGSYCFLVCDDPPERLNILKEVHDGFELAEYDLRARGAGDFIGLNQHGRGLSGCGLISQETLARAKDLCESLLAVPERAAALKESISQEERRHLEKISLN